MGITRIEGNDLTSKTANEAAPNLFYLDGYGNFRAKPKAVKEFTGAYCNRDSDPVLMEFPFDAFTGYPRFGNVYVDAGIKGGVIVGAEGYPMVEDAIRKLSEAEGIPVK